MSLAQRSTLRRATPSVSSARRCAAQALPAHRVRGWRVEKSGDGSTEINCRLYALAVGG